jgi:hypothetical protein
VQGFSESDEWRESGLAQVVNGAEEARDQLLTLAARFVLLEQQVAEPLFEAVDEVKGGMLGQV